MGSRCRSALVGGLLLAITAVLCQPACSDSEDGAGQAGTSPSGGAGGGGAAGGGGTGGSRKSNGEPCSEPSECESGNCVDDVCCAGSCSGACRACDSPGYEGQCTQHAVLTDPESECPDGVCDGAGECASGTHRWSDGFGDAADNQFAHDLAVDRSRNIIVVGHFEGTVNFGAPGDELVSQGGRDIFVVKFAPDGSHLWSKSFGGAGDQIGYGVDVDVLDSIVIAGSFENAVNFGAAGDELVSQGAQDIFLARFAADGTYAWSHAYGAASDQVARAIEVTPCGDVALTGWFAGELNFGTAGDELTTAGDDDIFFVRFEPDGTHRWSKSYGDASDAQLGRALGSDVDGNAIVVGQFTGEVDFGDRPLTSAGGTDIFVAKLDAEGTCLWSKSAGDGNEQLVGGVAVDRASNVLITGSFNGAITFGTAGDEMTSAGAADIFVAKLDPQGVHLWSKRFGDAADQAGGPHAVATDGGNNVVLAGSFASAVDFGGGELWSAGLGDIYLAKFSADGTPLWSRRFGDESDQQGAAVTADVDRQITTVGSFHGAVDCGGEPLSSQGGQDIFVAAFAP